MGTSLKQLTLESGATYRFRGEPITVSGTGVSVSIGTAAAERPAILDAEGLSRHFIVRAGASLTLHNVILQHGLVSGGEDGGSVHVSGQGSSLRLFGVHVRYNTAAGAGFWDKRGGGVFAGDGAAVNVSGSTFTNNSAAFGGAVCASASVLHVSGGSRFEGNSGPRGACIGLQRARREDVPAYGTVLDTVFDRCTATWYGGGVYALGSTLEMSRVQLRSCAVTWGGLNYGGGGLFAMSYQRLTTQVDLDDVTFDRCSTLREGGGIKAMRSATSTESPELRLTNVVFSACAAGDGGGMLTYICLVTLTRVDFLDCHASGAGGGLVLSGGSPAPASLSRVQFSRCVSTGDEPSGGGGLFMKDSAAAVVEDSDFTDCDATGRGGAIASVPQPDNVLTCTRVTFLRCHSAWGGALAFFGVLSLHDSHALQCHAKFCGAFRLSAPLVFSMVGGSIQGCYATEHDLSYAGALYAYVGTQATLTNVEVADCYSTRGAAIMSAGKSLVLRGCNLLRLGSGNTAAWSGALEVVAGARSLEVEDTLIAGSTPGAGPPSPPGAGCIHVGGGSTTLRNVTLSRCSHGSDAVSAALRVGNDAAIVGALVHVVTSCAAPPMQPLLQAYGAAANTSRALALRHLRISADGCNLPAASTLLGVGTTIATCAQLRDVADASCGTSATCTDGAVFGSGGPLPLASAECSCTGSAFARLTDESSAELLPYGFGCFTQRVASSVSVLGVTAQSVSFRLAKSAVADQMQTQTLRIAMEGTDLRMGAAWEVSSTPAWLSVPKATGALNETDEYAQFAVSATTAGQAGRGEPYEATLNVSTVSGLSRSFAVPVLLYVSAATVEAVWGVVNAGGSCANTSAPVTSLVVGASVRVSFVGCDRDGLKNALRTDGFAANATTPDGTSVGVEIEFDEVSGAYAVLFSSTQPGTYSLRLRLAGQPVATPIALVVEGCPDGEVPNPDDPTKPCKPCLGSSWALEGDLTCGRCREGFYHVGGGQNEGSGQCLQCPVGGICEAASTITDILMDIGWWRLTNFTVDIRRCDLFDDTAKTPCRGGVVDSLCAQGEGNLHGPLCALCDPPGADDLGYWYKPESGTCARCPEPSGRVITIVMVIFAVLAIVGLLAFVYHRPPSGLASTSAWLHRTARLLEPLGLWPKWKQLISFFQVLFSLASVYRTKLPRQFYDALAWLNWITFDIFDIYPADCVGSVADRLLLVAIGPLVFVAVVVACSAFVGLFAGSVRKWVAYGCSAGLVIVWALTPPVSQMILQSYDCETFGVIDDTNSTLDELGESVHLIEDVQYMHSAMRVTCGSPEHERITALSGVFIAIWPVGMPLLLAALLAAAQRPPPSAEAGKRSQGTNGSAAAPKADDDAPSPWPGTSLLAVATAPLSREYEKVSHFWEVLELVRRLVISAGLLAIPSTYGMTRLTIALVSCFLYLILLFTVRPFKRIDDTIVASASNTLLVFTFLTAILIKTFDDIAEDRRGSTSLARRVLGFHSSFDISLTLIFIGFAYVTIVVTIVLLKLKRVAESASVQQGHRNRERVLRAIASKHQLRHPAVFIPYDVLRKLGRLMAHEEVRDTGELRVVDTFEKLVEFTRDEATLFVSHQWLGHTAPDSPDHAQYRALCEACDELCNLKGITPRKLYVWVEYVHRDSNPGRPRALPDSRPTFECLVRQFRVHPAGQPQPAEPRDRITHRLRLELQLLPRAGARRDAQRHAPPVRPAYLRPARLVPARAVGARDGRFHLDVRLRPHAPTRAVDAGEPAQGRHVRLRGRLHRRARQAADRRHGARPLVARARAQGAVLRGAAALRAHQHRAAARLPEGVLWRAAGASREGDVAHGPAAELR